MLEVILWWVEGRKKIGVIGYRIDCAQPTQGQGGRMEEKDFSSKVFIWMVRSEDHLGLSVTQSGRLVSEMTSAQGCIA